MSETPYIVSARKYRPSTFKSVVGQKNLTATLKNAIDTGRLAQAYLFCGPRGVGKTSCARIFAKTINCLSPTEDGEACGQCESCKAIEAGNSFNIIELDAASNNSVNDIRDLTEQVNIPPNIGKYRVFIIDEVHMLSSQAFNAFLKTLEEPPKYVIFILATTEKHKVIPTILSRCQIYDFKRITIQDMVEHLQYVAQSEGIAADTESLNVIARKADGAMRDALSIFDQVAASSFGNITYQTTLASLNVLDYDYYFRLVDTFREGDIPKALMIYKEIRDHGFDTLFFINGLASHIRDLMVSFSPQTASLLEVADDVAQRYTAQAQSLPIEWHYAAMKILNACDYAYRTASNKQFLTELTLIRLCQLQNPPTAPFDRVDNDDTLPLRDIVAPPSTPSVAQSATPTTPESQENSELPVSTPSATEERPTPRRTTAKRRPSTFRLSDVDPDAPQAGTLNQKRDSFSPESLNEWWDSFIAQNPEQHLLISAMRSSRPEMVNEETYRVTVNHPALKQAFEGSMQTLLGFLRSKVNNDFLSLDIVIDTSAEVVKQLPPQELLKDMLQNNKHLATFFEEADMETV